MRKYLLLLLLLCSFCATKAYGQGTCPSDSQTRNPVTGALVSLATIGVNGCYFIAASGSDSNTGVDESHPWAHAPGMPNCTATCATINSGSLAGLGFIFKKGDCWHFGNPAGTSVSGAVPCGAGPYTGGVWNITKGGSSVTNKLYFGDSPSWTSTTSTARPIMDADNPPNASTTLGSCGFFIGGNVNNNNFTSVGGGTNVVFHDFWWAGMCQGDIAGAFGPGGACASPSAGTNNHVFTYGTTFTAEDNKFSSFSHIQFGVPTAPESCVIGTVVFNSHIFRNGGGDENILYNVQDNSDSDPIAQGWGFYSGGNVAWNWISTESFGGEMSFSGMCTYHDNTMTTMIDNGHGDWLEQLAASCNPVTIYNNLWIHMATAKTQGGLWPFGGATNYIFNNVSIDWNSSNGQDIALGGTPTFPGNAQMNYFNNTFQWTDTATGAGVIQCSAQLTTASILDNEHIIYGPSGSAYGGAAPCNSNSFITLHTNLTQTNTLAKTYYPYGAQAYPTQQFAYSPVNATSPTVGVGTNEMAKCNTLAANSNQFAASAGAACKFDTTYGVTYDGNRVTANAHTPVARPTTGAWDIGAFQFVASSGNPIASLSPTSLNFGTIKVTQSSTPQNIVLSNTGTATLTISGISLTGANPGDYSFTTVPASNCGGSVAAGGSCTIQVTFTPITSGSRIANISVSDNAAGSPHTASLSGTGVYPNAPNPVCMPGTGTYSTPPNPMVTCTDIAPVMCYTLDGITIPATNGTTGCSVGNLYSGALTMTVTTILTVTAGGTNYSDSSPAIVYMYTINPAAVAPVPQFMAGR